MGILSKLLGFEKRISLENPSVSLASPDAMEKLGFYSTNTAGVQVNLKTILSIPSVWRGLNIVSNSVGKLIPYVYKEDEEEGGRQKYTDHPAYYLLSCQANRYCTARDLRRSLVYHALVYGNGYAFIVRNGANEPMGMKLLPAWNFEQFGATDTGDLVYYFYVDGKSVPLLAEDIFHIRGLSRDGATGESVIEMLAGAFGVSLAEQEFAASYFGKGVTAGTVVSFRDGVQRENIKEIYKDLKLASTGMNNANGLFVLPPGVEAKPLGTDPEAAQLLESRGFSIKQIANIIGIPSYMLNDGGAGNSTLEVQNQTFLDHSLDVWLDAFEDEAERKLLSDVEQRDDTICIEFDRSRLLKTDIATRYRAYSIGRQWGWLSVNEIRDEEGKEYIEGGDEYLRPGNMAVVEDPESPAEDLTDDPTEEDPGQPDPTQVGNPMKDPEDVNNTGAVRSVPLDIPALASLIAGAATSLQGVREKRLTREKDHEKVQTEVRGQLVDRVTPMFALRFGSASEDKVGQFLEIWDQPDCEAQLRELLK